MRPTIRHPIDEKAGDSGGLGLADVRRHALGTSPLEAADPAVRDQWEHDVVDDLIDHFPRYRTHRHHVVRGFGLGGVTLPLFATAYLGLDRTQIADASIITRAAQQIGGSFGSAILVLANQLTHHPADHINAYQTTFWFTIAFTLAAILLALRLPTRLPAKATRLPAAKAAGASTR